MRLYQLWVLILLILQDTNSVDGCKSNGDGCGSGYDTLAMSLAIRVGDLFASAIPFGGATTTTFWMFSDTLGSDKDVICYIKNLR